MVVGLKEETEEGKMGCMYNIPICFIYLLHLCQSMGIIVGLALLVLVLEINNFEHAPLEFV